MLCLWVHFKCIIVDGVKAYFGSANLTGAGMGAKSKKKRNFENGVLTDAPALVEPLVEPVIAKPGLLFGGAAGLSIFENLIGSIGNKRIALPNQNQIVLDFLV